MKYKYVYKCQRCGVVFEDKKVRDSGTSCEFLNPLYEHEHVCGTNEHGVGHPVGFNRIDEVTGTPPAITGRFGRIARLIHRGLGDEAASELRRMQREEDENNIWLPTSGAPKDSRGNIIPSVYYGYTTVHCASGLIRHNGTEWEWITCCHRGIGDAGQPIMFCPIPEAPDVPR